MNMSKQPPPRRSCGIGKKRRIAFTWNDQRIGGMTHIQVLFSDCLHLWYEGKRWTWRRMPVIPLGQDTITLTVSDGINSVDVVASAITEWIDIVNAFLDGAYPDHENADDIMTSWFHRHDGGGSGGGCACLCLCPSSGGGSAACLCSSAGASSGGSGLAD